MAVAMAAAAAQAPRHNIIEGVSSEQPLADNCPRCMTQAKPRAKGSEESSFIVSPTPSSVCPTESTAPGTHDDVARDSDCDDFYDDHESDTCWGIAEEEEDDWASAGLAVSVPTCGRALGGNESVSVCASEARRWQQVGARLGGLFSALAEDGGYDFSSGDDASSTEEATSEIESEDDDEDADAPLDAASGFRGVLGLHRPSSDQLEHTSDEDVNRDQVCALAEAGADGDAAGPAPLTDAASAAPRGAPSSEGWRCVGYRLAMVLREADTDSVSDFGDVADTEGEEPEPESPRVR
eukprot:TRINITY_DN25694_c0_g1_i1.p1 TRINITY_DN25694_c0_g1~~TRINITY_DN25694_c0_g1_i1.p1  ORF type:complete len:295 (+),score=65.75 TRINITY_DN25694_c0_g1_i1:50-934(+)